MMEIQTGKTPNICKSMKSIPLSPEEIEKIKCHCSNYETEVKAAIVLGLDRMNIKWALLNGTTSPATYEALKKNLFNKRKKVK